MPRIVMRIVRLARIIAALALFGGVAQVAIGAGGANATTFLVGGSWYWQSQPPPQPPVCLPGQVPSPPPPAGQCIPIDTSAVPQQPPDVPTGDFPVSVQNGSSDKETYLHVDVSAIPQGSTASAFVLKLNEDSQAPGDSLAATAAVKAYAVTSYFPDGAAARPYTERPPYDARGTSIAGKRNAPAAGSTAPVQWTFDITPIVNQWLSGAVANNGVALVGDASQSSTFEVVWTGPSSSAPPTADGTVTPGPGSLSPAAPTATEVAPGPAASVGPAPAPVPPALPIVDQPVPAAADHAGAAVTAPRASGQGAAPSRARRRPSSHHAPSVAFFLAGLGLIALVGAGTVALGPGGDPTGRRQGSVLRALEKRATPLTGEGGSA